MITNQYHIVYNGVLGSLSVENLLKYKGKKIKFIKNYQFVEKTVLIQELAEDINEESRKTIEELLDEWSGRMENGRFDCYNIRARKIFADDEKVYLLYLLCGTLEKTGKALGLSRQTVANWIKSYKKYIYQKIHEK